MKKVPSGAIRAIPHGNSFQYYLRSNPKEKNGIYLPKKNSKLVNALCQKEYNEKVLKEAQKEIRILKQLNNLYSGRNINTVYDSMPKGKRAVIIPVEEPEEEFVKRWREELYDTVGFFDESKVYTSNRGEQMRSKSEVIIAGIFDQYGIPYKYEKPLRLKKGIIVHPDFTLLDIKHRREIYYEHFGMMDYSEYAEKAIAKIISYEQSGFYLGERLLASAETSLAHLNIQQTKEMIYHYFFEK